MKYFSLICLISLIFCAKNLQRAKEISAYVNSLNTTWKATEKSFDTDGYLGTFLRGQENVIPKKTQFSVSLSDLPSSFDLRDAYPNCESLKEIRDQSKCGSCWAFGAAETMSDRICIKSGQKLQTRVSPQHLVTCCSICGFGCSGGWPSMAFYSWWWSGVPTGGLYGDTKTCKPYFLPPCEDHPHKCTDYVDTPACENVCQESYNKTVEEDLSFGESVYSVSGEEDIMKEIYEYGSVEGSFEVYEDFEEYKSGIYQYTTGSLLGGHAIKIIGWGEENGVKYWLIANSWGENWGENGFFRMLRGNNECGIEESASTGIAKLDEEKLKYIE